MINWVRKDLPIDQPKELSIVEHFALLIDKIDFCQIDNMISKVN